MPIPSRKKREISLAITRLDTEVESILVAARNLLSAMRKAEREAGISTNYEDRGTEAYMKVLQATESLRFIRRLLRTPAKEIRQ